MVTATSFSQLMDMEKNMEKKVVPQKGGSPGLDYSRSAESVQPESILPDISAENTEDDGTESETGSNEDKEDNQDDSEPEEAQESKPKAISRFGAPDGLQASKLDERLNLPTLSPELVGEIRKMIQEEFGALRKLAERAQSNTGGPQLRKEPPARSSPGASRSPAQPNTAAPRSGSPDRVTVTPGTNSPKSPPVSPKRHGVRFADEEMSGGTSRVGTSPTVSTSKPPQLTAIDEKWGSLFDDRGYPTPRLRQILRGLANYIICEFMPQRSIVITPEKMATFYSMHKLESEVFPFVGIFRSRFKTSHGRIEDLYQDLGCEYHLVQRDAKTRPSVPALTQAGFAQWLIATMVAYPDAEARRLADVVSALPIDADNLLDGMPERLPKQLSRHLFPRKPDRKSKQLLDEAMRDCVEDISSPIPPKSTPQQATSARVESIPDKRLPTSGTSGVWTKYAPEQRSRVESVSPPKNIASDANQYPIEWGTSYICSDGYERPSDSSAATRRDQFASCLGRVNSDDAARATTGKPHIPLPPPPVGQNSGVPRRRSPPATDQYRHSIAGEITNAVVYSPQLPPSSSTPAFTPTSGSMSPTYELSSVVARERELRDREDDRRHYFPRDGRSAFDYTPRPIVSVVSLVDNNGPNNNNPNNNNNMNNIIINNNNKVPDKAAVTARGSVVIADGGNPGPTWDEYLTRRQGGSTPRNSNFPKYSCS